MPSTSGKAKLERVISQLENIQVLIGGLPRYIIQSGERRKNMRRIIEDLQDIEVIIQKLHDSYDQLLIERTSRPTESKVINKNKL